MIQALPNAKTKEPMERFLRLSDSMEVVRSKAKVYFTSVIYDASQVRKENERFRSQLQLLFIALGVLLCVGGAYFVYQRLRMRYRVLRATYETELRMSKKLHDELANDMFQTLSFVEQQTPDSPDKDTLLDRLDALYAQTRSLSRSSGVIDTGERFENELKELMAGFSSPHTRVLALDVGAVPWSNFRREAKITLYRVLQELLVNMKKHSAATRVQVRFIPDKRGVTVTYTDNGKGGEVATILKNGLSNAENRIFTLGGSISFDSQPNAGWQCQFRIPKS